MGFLSIFFGQKKHEKSIHDLKFYEEIVDQIVVSETLKTHLKLDLKQAFENPKSFYDDNDDFILSERGLKYPKDILLTPKFVLIDTLIDNGQMAEVDWKEDENEIRFCLNEIRLAKDYDFTISDDTLYDENETIEIIQFIDKKELNIQDYSIEFIDINSDSYVFTVIPLKDKQKIKSMFEKI